MPEKEDIIQEYFEKMAQCHSLNCQKVIFEQEKRIEWFFEDDSWCYFDFNCDDDFYTLKKDDNKIFLQDCIIKDMSYEIKMLLGFTRLRNVTSIDKTLFANYVNKFENEKLNDLSLSIEKYNYNLRTIEDESFKKADKIANNIMGGCFVLAIVIAFLFLITLFAFIKTKFFS